MFSISWQAIVIGIAQLRELYYTAKMVLFLS